MVRSSPVKGSCRCVSQRRNREPRSGAAFGPFFAALPAPSGALRVACSSTAFIQSPDMLASRAMKYRVTIEGEERDVDVTILPDGRVGVALDGEPQDVDVVRVPGGLSLRIGARVIDLAIGGPPDAVQLAAGERRAGAEVLSERMRARRRGGATLGGGGTELRAPMPGRVVKVLVTAGQAVAHGAPCVVIEAMKMENELRAPIGGEVAEVLASEGSSVEGGALLVRFVPAG
ncbi:MAG: hypothetical protein KF729_29470 [Sandaracinaceae bacterium]|nr:hypothetical protein [Sandaracinaceae bacterium]